ncbi:MAG TPA: glycosyltransferase family 2 protein [Candidatus Sulfotelmatobacter sp.]|nr:glycosyltransferase family 2 protein [Candidatus Sulfotelmatobacter sp.]
MPKLEDSKQLLRRNASDPLPITAIVATRDEAHNLSRCMESLRDLGEVYVVDSQSTDATVEIAESYGGHVVQFHYQGGWPKKRQWAMDSLPLSYDWVFLIDADESMTPELAAEIRRAIQNPACDGYYVALRMFFLGQELRHSGASFYKLSLFRRGKGRFECRLKDQDQSMADMEVHEHIVLDAGSRTASLTNPLLHHNVESLSRYIRKHDEYSNWEAQVWLAGESSAKDLRPSFFGSQAQRRRWLRKRFFAIPGSPILFFFYKYVFSLGFLDGMPGLIYCTLQGIQFFHIKAKIYELKMQRAAQKGSR